MSDNYEKWPSQYAKAKDNKNIAGSVSTVQNPPKMSNWMNCVVERDYNDCLWFFVCKSNKHLQYTSEEFVVAEWIQVQLVEKE